MLGVDIKQDDFERWGGLALISAIFMVATGATFSSLGVLLPSMIAEFEWSWTQGGAGFTVVGLFTGLSSTLPAHAIKRFNIRACYAIAAIVLLIGFIGLALINGFIAYLLAAAIIGTGYSMVATVPAVTALSNGFNERRSLAIGIFFTSGAVGSILGPLVSAYFIQILESWRAYWAVIGVVVALICLVASLTIKRLETPRQTKSDAAKGTGEDSKQSGVDEEEAWTLREVLRSPQFYVIVTALTVTLLGALTMNAWQFTHMQNMGVAANVAAGALSAHAIFNALSRAAGGVFIDRIGAKWVMASGLVAGVIGMAALAQADNPILIALYAFGDGYSFGIVTFASSIMLLKYYGQKHNPEILGVMNLISTVAMIGPIAAGRIAEATGGFFVVFMGLSVILLITFVLQVLLPAPTKQRAAPAEKTA